VRTGVAQGEAEDEMLRRGAMATTADTAATPDAVRWPGGTGTAEAPDANAVAILVRRAQAGDRMAFERLVERRVDGAYRVARAILGNEADARDATQDAFLDAWRQRARLRDPSRFEAWLGRILVNSCREFLRGRRRRSVREIAMVDGGDPLDAMPATDPPPDELTVEVDTIERAFERLRHEERSILVLHHLEHQPVSEIAATLNIPVGTVKSRLHAARHALERALEAELR
jgi:RNA polymerase sigma-70 factor (ECF subfamily)